MILPQGPGKRILKYTLDPDLLNPETNEIIVTLPRRAQVLSAGAQQEHIRIWAMIDADDPGVPTQRRFMVIPTGLVDFDDSGYHFVDTVIIMDGMLVFHIFAQDY